MKDTEESFLNFAYTYLQEKAELLRCTKCNRRVKQTNFKHLAKCCNAKCRTRVYLFSNKLVKNSNLGLEKVLKLLYYLFNYYEHKTINQLLGVSKKTIKRYKQVLLKLFKKHKKQEKIKIGGDNIIVEIDESLFGKRKYNKGRIVKGVWVLGIVERTERRKIALTIVKKRDKKTLSKKIRKYVFPSSNIMTDKWAGYNDLKFFFPQHLSVNHSYNFVDPQTHAHTQTIESNWSVLKQHIPKRHRNIKHIRFYLLLYMFRRNWGNDFYLNLLNKL